MSNRLKASLFMLVFVAGTGALLYARYRPKGYRYDFAITSRTIAPGGAATELKWAGTGLERQQEVLNMDRNEGALDVKLSAMIPEVDTSAGFSSLRRKNSSRWMGDGGEIAGHQTRIFRYTDYDTLFVTSDSGRRMAHANKVVTDYYVAESVGEVGRRFSRFADSINLRLAGLEPHQVRGRVSTRQHSYDGVPLRIVSQVSWVDGAGNTSVTTTESRISSLEQASVSATTIRDLRQRVEATRTAARKNGWEYEFRITTQDGAKKGEAPVIGKAEVFGEETRVTLEPREGRRRDRNRRGEYLLISEQGRQIAVIRPNDKEYNVLSADSLAHMVSVGLNAAGRLVDLQLGGLDVSSEKLGTGERIAGYDTERHRMSQAYRIDMRIFGARPTLRGKLITDFWVAPALQVPGNPFFDFFAMLPNALAMQSPDYVRKSLAERSKIFETLPLRTVATLEMTDQEGKVSRSSSTIEVTSIRRASLDPDRFEIPSRYKAVKGADISF